MIADLESLLASVSSILANGAQSEGLTTGSSASPGRAGITASTEIGAIPEWDFSEGRVRDEEFNSQIVHFRESFNDKRAKLLSLVAKAQTPPKNQAYNGLIEECRSLETKHKHLGQQLEALGRQMQVIEGAQMTPDEAANWQEREADEVGLDFFTRARFPSYAFRWLFVDVLPNFDAPASETPGSSAPMPEPTDGTVDGDEDSSAAPFPDGGQGRSIATIDQALAACLAQRGAGVPPERGLLSHRLPCWRLYNARLRKPLENLRELSERDQLSQGSAVMTAPTFADMVKEIGVAPSLAVPSPQIDLPESEAESAPPSDVLPVRGPP